MTQNVTILNSWQGERQLVHLQYKDFHHKQLCLIWRLYDLQLQNQL